MPAEHQYGILSRRVHGRAGGNAPHLGKAPALCDGHGVLRVLASAAGGSWGRGAGRDNGALADNGALVEERLLCLLVLRQLVGNLLLNDLVLLLLVLVQNGALVQDGAQVLVEEGVLVLLVLRQLVADLLLHLRILLSELTEDVLLDLCVLGPLRLHGAAHGSDLQTRVDCKYVSSIWRVQAWFYCISL